MVKASFSSAGLHSPTSATDYHLLLVSRPDKRSDRQQRGRASSCGSSALLVLTLHEPRDLCPDVLYPPFNQLKIMNDPELLLPLIADLLGKVFLHARRAEVPSLPKAPSKSSTAEAPYLSLCTPF